MKASPIWSRMIPYLGEGIAGYELVNGKDIFTGDKVVDGLSLATGGISRVVGKGGAVKAAEIGGGAGKTIELPSTSFTISKLQHEFKHAGDFGVTGNWNKATGEIYQKAIQSHIDTATDIYKSTYRGQDVYVYINKNTGVGAYTDLLGNYIGGWKFSSDQLNFHISNGIKIK